MAARIYANPDERRAARNARARAVAKTRRLRGLCTKCDRHAAPGKTKCDQHLEEQRKQELARVKRAVKDGKCYDCGRKPPTTGGRCDGCHERRTQQDSYGTNVTRARRERAMECTGCGTELDGDVYKTCQDCRDVAAEKQRQRAAERLAKGLCGKCGKEPHCKGSAWGKRCRARRRGADGKL